MKHHVACPISDSRLAASAFPGNFLSGNDSSLKDNIHGRALKVNDQDHLSTYMDNMEQEDTNAVAEGTIEYEEDRYEVEEDHSPIFSDGSLDVDDIEDAALSTLAKQLDDRKTSTASRAATTKRISQREIKRAHILSGEILTSDSESVSAFSSWEVTQEMMGRMSYLESDDDSNDSDSGETRVDSDGSVLVECKFPSSDTSVLLSLSHARKIPILASILNSSSSAGPLTTDIEGKVQVDVGEIGVSRQALLSMIRGLEATKPRYSNSSDCSSNVSCRGRLVL